MIASPIIVARALVREGFAVFPVFNRSPLTPHGVYSASRSLSEFGKLNWRDANGVGIGTGEVNGIDVLDVDIRQPREGQGKSPSSVQGRDGIATLASLPPLPETRIASTPNGGRHYWFRHIEGSRNCKLGDGSLEWFSDGKLVVVPPAPGREWICETEIAQAPHWLKVMVLSPPPLPRHAVQRTSGPLVTATGSSHVPKPIYMLILCGMPNASRHAQRRVRGLWSNLAAKGQHRNDGLNYTAWEYRGFVQGGDLEAEVAANLLWLACEANGYLAKDGEDAVKEVINRVLKTGEPQNGSEV
jgi:Bifunctional DNA primase/polymerase, N-terminal